MQWKKIRMMKIHVFAFEETYITSRHRPGPCCGFCLVKCQFFRCAANLTFTKSLPLWVQETFDSWTSILDLTMHWPLTVSFWPEPPVWCPIFCCSGRECYLSPWSQVQVWDLYWGEERAMDDRQTVMPVCGTPGQCMIKCFYINRTQTGRPDHLFMQDLKIFDMCELMVLSGLIMFVYPTLISWHQLKLL